MMRIDDSFPFLLRVAIPEVTDQSCIPNDEEFATYFPELSRNPRRSAKRSSNLVWDAIWRAHRDVLTGFRFKDSGFYTARKQAGEPDKGTINGITLKLFELIALAKQPLSSQYLIDGLCAQFNEPEGLRNDSVANLSATTFGAIQKLVNMTLKYLLILEAFGRLNEGWLDDIQIDETACDCPVDSVVLEMLAKNHKELKGIKWTRITEEQYESVQKAIDNELGSCNRIMYDFKYWQADDEGIR